VTFSWEAAYAGTLLIVTLLGGAPTWPTPAQTHAALASLKIDVPLPAPPEREAYKQWFIEATTRLSDQIEASQRVAKRQFEKSRLYMDSEIEEVSRNADEICKRSLHFGLPALKSALRDIVRAEPGDESERKRSSTE
jgi:hypothetical protein